MKSQSVKFNNIYIDSIGIIVSKKEKLGPLGMYFNHYIDDYYFQCKSFEKAQIKLSNEAIKLAISHSIYKENEISIAFGGDLSNQLYSSTASLKQYDFPFVGLYAACASGILSIILASLYMQGCDLNNALAFTSSHVCVSQRQFRYPNEYASLIKDSMTSTVTGGCAVILTNMKKQIRISKCTIGRIIDVLSKNVNDMGTCMAFSAIDTLINHLNNNNESINDYDLFVTGDLGDIGSKVFIDVLKEKGYDIISKHIDCGSAIYDKEKQDIKAGGSGPACVMCVTFSYIINQMMKKIYKKVLVIATGSLHSQISYQQKETIPCIAHAIVLEVT
ncbi:MAG: stage V sporulation protein AD [Erysipelotrichaceae bacterium]|nr:stage V sporulation protein AD [Erysipelotrichaceae bacterium]